MSQDIESTVAQLEAWRDRIAAAVETLKYFLAQGPGLPPSPPPVSGSRTVTDSEIRHDSFFQMTIPDAAEKYLTIVKVTKTTGEIADGLLNGGLKTAAKNFPETLRSIMGRDERFVRVNGEWGLAVWYPAMKRDRKARPAPEPSQAKTEKESDSQRVGKKGSKSKKAQKPKNTEKIEKDAGTIDQKILRFIDREAAHSFSPSEVAKNVDANPNSIKAALAALYKHNLIGKPEQGRYQSLKREAAA